MTYRKPWFDPNGYPAELRTVRSIVFLVSALLAQSVVAASNDLTLSETLDLAFSRQDPTVARHLAATNALGERARSESQLPDPQLRFGLVNWPTDSLDYDQEPMTQLQVGVKQEFPRGNTRAATRMRLLAESDVERAAAALQQRQIKLEVRSAWLELFYWHRARGSVMQSRAALRELVGVVESSFATGLQSNQDLLRAELELSLLDDRAVDVERQIEVREADLARFIGAADAARSLSSALPELPGLPSPERLREALLEHPALLMEDARVRVGARNVDVAKAQFKPGFSVDLGYGARGADRADLASVMLLVDIPLFASQRQAPGLAAAEHDRASAEMARAARLLELKQALDRAQADWSGLGERAGLYEEVVLQRAASSAEAALAGYQSRVSDFAELIRARLDYLDMELKLRRLETDRALAHSRLLFIAGESP